ncbi:hypothetical protein G6F51_014600 [Rhizopus arrhizus]|uniref:Uncharacterized protein n=1 Tax=Rhizopus oryzae TaxID=64495 RepID=A0A9P6XLA4_RHIOR|nr:hypothetical protein G6F51_014600 [Rhizopus arrhizus]
MSRSRAAAADARNRPGVQVSMRSGDSMARTRPSWRPSISSQNATASARPAMPRASSYWQRILPSPST